MRNLTFNSTPMPFLFSLIEFLLFIILIGTCNTFSHMGNKVKILNFGSGQLYTDCQGLFPFYPYLKIYENILHAMIYTKQ